MKVDLRHKIKREKTEGKLTNNHREIFEQRLQMKLHKKPKNDYMFLKIVASVLILLSLGFLSYQFFESNISKEVVQTEKENDKRINSIADISPDLKKVEDFYLTQINYQISKIKITDENKDLLEVYLSQLSELQQEYDDLNIRLSVNEVNEKTIDALIENLQLRLQLLRQLKKKLKIIETLMLEHDENKNV